MAPNRKSPERKTGVAAWNESAGISTRASSSGRSRRSRAEANRKRRIFLLVALAVLCVAALVCAWPIKERIERGLWLKGGTAYSFTVAQEDGSKPTSDELAQAMQAVRGRLAASGVAEHAVSQEGDDSFAIALSNTFDGEGVARIVGGAGVVEFVRVDEIGDADALVKVNAGTQDVELRKGTYTSFLDGSSVASASVEDVGSGTYAVHIAFNDEGAQTFADVTRELAQDLGRIAIVIDGRVNSAPSVSEEISGGEVYITGDFSYEEANALKAVLDSDALPLTLTYAGSHKIGPLLSKAGLWALVAAAAVVFVAVSVLAFRRFGRLAVLVLGAMAVYAVLMLGCMALASRLGMFVLTIPGVGGGACAAIATAGCTWLVVARFQAKVREGRTVRGAATAAPREGLGPVAYPCLGVVVVALVLLFVPVPALRDSGLALVLGAICSVAAVGWYAITLLRLLAAGTVQSDPGAWGLGTPVAHAAGDKAS